MACVVGPTDAGMSKFDKGNMNKVALLWEQRVLSENRVCISTDRVFRVGSEPHIMCEKPNNWDPTQVRDVLTEEFGHPPAEEINDMKFLGIEAHPRDRFDLPQSTYQELGWAGTAGYMDEKKLKEEHFSNFKRKIVKDKTEKETGYITGLQNIRDKRMREHKRIVPRNPMAHHVGYITGLEDNPYERTIKDVEGAKKYELYKDIKKKEREIYMRFNKGQYMPNHKKRSTDQNKKKTNMQATKEAYEAGKRQPMAHTLGMITDLGYDDIASQVKWDEDKQKWYVLNEFEKFKQGGDREGERGANAKVSKIRKEMERGQNGQSVGGMEKNLTKTTVDMLLGHSEAINQGGNPQATTKQFNSRGEYEVQTSNGDYGREQPRVPKGWSRSGAYAGAGGPDDDTQSSVLTSSSVVEPNRGPGSVLGDDDTEMARINSKYDIFAKKVERTKRDLAIKYRKLQKVTKGNKHPLYYKPLTNCDVTVFADAYTKQMLTGPHMKTQLLVSR